MVVCNCWKALTDDVVLLMEASDLKMLSNIIQEGMDKLCVLSRSLEDLCDVTVLE